MMNGRAARMVVCTRVLVAAVLGTLTADRLAVAAQPLPAQPRPLYSQELARADSLVKLQGGPRAERALLFLTWDAPYGRRGARDTKPLRAKPGGIDTLYLAFMPGRTSASFNGFTAELVFHAAPGDTLGPWWHMEKTGENAGGLMAQFGPDSSFPQRQPWHVAGQGYVKLDRTPTTAKLRVVYAVPLGASDSLQPDSVYTLGRVLLKHDRDLPGRIQPVCVEWAVAGLAFGLKDEPQVRRGERFVGFASGVGGVCTPYRNKLETWRPAKSGAKPVK